MSCGQCNYEKISIFDRSFWDLWAQKMLRNVASVKYQLLILYSTIITYGMFFKVDSSGEPYIGATEGLAFMGGGFISLITARLAARTSLFEPSDTEASKHLDTDK